MIHSGPADGLPSERAAGRGEQGLLFLECRTGDLQVLRETLEVQKLKPCITWKDRLPEATFDGDFQEAGSCWHLSSVRLPPTYVHL